MLFLIIQFCLGLLYANAGEWVIHKYILHALGKKKNSFWAYHLYEHHSNCYRNGMIDPGYQRLDIRTWNTQTKELIVMFCFLIVHAPLLPIVPSFILALYLSLALYYFWHRKAHLDPVWAKRHLRWHYDHHMDEGVAGNWCVTWPLFDYVFRTRVKSRIQDHFN